MEIFRRAVRRAGGRLALSAGMRPKPLLSLALPLAVGVEGLRELCEFDLAEEPPADFASGWQRHFPRAHASARSGALRPPPRPAAARVVAGAVRSGGARRARTRRLGRPKPPERGAALAEAARALRGRARDCWWRRGGSDRVRTRRRESATWTTSRSSLGRGRRPVRSASGPRSTPQGTARPETGRRGAASGLAGLGA